MSSNVVSGIDKNKTSEVTHGVQKVGFSAVVGNVTRGPEIDVQNIERAAKWPRENELAVAGDGAVRSDAVRALKNPLGDVFADERPEEPESDAMQSLINTHMAGRRRGVVSREDVTTKRQRYNDEHQHFLVVLDWLKDNEFAVEK